MPWSEWITPPLVKSPPVPRSIRTLTGEARSDVWSGEWTREGWEGAADGCRAVAAEAVRYHVFPVSEGDRATGTEGPNLRFRVRAWSLSQATEPTLGLDQYQAQVELTAGWVTYHWTEYPDHHVNIAPPDLPADATDYEYADAPTVTVRWRPDQLGWLGDGVRSAVPWPQDASFAVGKAFVGEWEGYPGLPTAPSEEVAYFISGSADDNPRQRVGVASPALAQAGQDLSVSAYSSHLLGTPIEAPDSFQSGSVWVHEWVLETEPFTLDLQLPAYRYWIADRDIPLRQRQRDDGLGLGAGRWRRGTSRQASNRWGSYL